MLVRTCAQGGTHCEAGLIVSGPARTGANTLFFLSLLLWAFLGVAIAADVFMAGIERITSQEEMKTLVLPSGEVRRYSVTVWNATVANLTLMALGSSAPEILLSVIEIGGNGFYAGELGPSTIVGSAAFNMLVISAVCVLAIPEGGGRLIKELPVFYITAVFSVLAYAPLHTAFGHVASSPYRHWPRLVHDYHPYPAPVGMPSFTYLPHLLGATRGRYVWLIIILVVITPNIVTIWEGVVTFAAFPVLVYMSYRADVDGAGSEGVEEDSLADSPEGHAAAVPIGYGKDGRPITRTDVARVLALKSIEKLEGEEQMQVTPSPHVSPHLRTSPPSMTFAHLLWIACAPSLVAQAVAALLLPPQSKAHYRQQAMRTVLGAKSTEEDEAGAMRARVLAEETEKKSEAAVAIVQWAAPKRMCRESDRVVELGVTRSGNTRVKCTVQYTSESGTATEGVDFEAARGTLTFAPGQTHASVSVNIIDDEEEEDDETFTVRLHTPAHCQIGHAPVCEVTIEDNDGPGELHFESREVEVFESKGHIVLTVIRSHGCQSSVSCHWSTRDGACRAPGGYKASAGVCVFREGVTEQTISVPVVDTGAYHRDDDFQVVLTSASGGARFVTDGTTRTRRATAACVITVCSDQDRRDKVDEMITMLDLGKEAVEVDNPPPLEHDSWSEQFQEAFDVPVDGSSISLILYVLALPWKVLGAAVPPPSYAGGWACFGVALVFIGALTALIGDFASHMGCCMGLQKSVTAITFVALGTSLPDTFASRSAAASEPYADASIVNVTGSNSVNVFLGLGLPWAAAAIYWAVYGEANEGMWRKRYAEEPWYTSDTPVGFAVPAGNLAYSVSVFSTAAVMCLAVIVLRRKTIGYELGGPIVLQWITAIFFVGLWFGYIYLSIAKTNASA